MMKMNIAFIVFACFVSAVVPGRIFRINNQCNQKLWFGIQGNPLIYAGGFEVDAHSSKDLNVPDKWESGRIWPRTNCRNVNGRFTCSTGDCGAGVNGFRMECNGIGGQPPVTLAEFTLDGYGDVDYYDLSNVDGNSVGMTIRPIPGQYTSVNNPQLGKYNCGAATCTFDANRCPPELKMDDGTGRVVCASICAAIHNGEQRAKHPHLQNIYNNADTRSMVCCSCDGNYCVSPHDNVTPGRKCYVENWPRSTDNRRYDEVFKSQCPDAYSWQFDDFASTYQCRKANYEIILCPNGGSSGQGGSGGGGSSNVNWNGNKWALACDFRGNDLSSAQVPAERCGPQCQQTSGCTHFTWTSFNGGTCWMKKGAISKNNAVASSDGSTVCGIL